jgi:hypothetical protein
MTKTEKVALINATIANERNAHARDKGCEAYLNDAGNIRYRDRSKGYPRRITLAELFGHMHGLDIRALKAAI